MSRERFELALSRIAPAQWERFEQLASQFLAADFPDLRTMASPSGDEGRDAELFSPKGAPTVVFQYSVAADWRSKILRTAKRLMETKPDTRILIYVTNQVVGADADEVKSTLLNDFSFTLDVRDRNWFLEREYKSSVQEAAAEALIHDIADPYLKQISRSPKRHTALTGDDARSALVYLELQWEDQGRERGLTKLAFEALVQSAVRGTDHQHRITRDDILARVRSLLPSHPPETVDMYANSALTRLARHKLRHWKETDEFALNAEEVIRLSSRLADVHSRDSKLVEETQKLLLEGIGDEAVNTSVLESLVARVKRVLEKFLLTRGERFSAALRTGSFADVGYEAINDIVIRDFSAHPDRSRLGKRAPDLTVNAIRALLFSPSPTMQSHLRSLADSYTLFSFLSETPDVQKVVSQMFSHGEIWFDTSFLLPVLLEELVDESERRYSAMLAAASEAGLALRVTPGVLEELDSHMHRSLLCARMPAGEWKSTVPFLLSGFTLSGKPISTFASWMEQFRGDSRSQDDIEDYLYDVHDIEVTNIDSEMSRFPDEMRFALDSAWRSAHETRRRFTEMDSLMQDRLIRHDVENFVAVLERRNQERESPFGYTSWLVTFDRAADQVMKNTRTKLGPMTPPSPLMSADFLSTYLTIGPLRSRVGRDTESRIPLLVETNIPDFVPAEFLAIAERTREEARNLPERIIRRRLRDKLDATKQVVGPIAKDGMGSILDTLKNS